jgi:phage gpG-like protein
MAVGKSFSGVMSGVSREGLMSIDFKPLPIILAGQFTEFAISIRSFREPLKRSVQRVVNPSIDKNFDVGGRPVWQELAPATLATRAKEGSGSQILVRSGKGRRAATALARWTISMDDAAYTGNFPPSTSYMAIHQIADTEEVFTGPGRQAFLPGRVFATIQDEDQNKIERVFREWLTERAMRAGLV